MSDEVGLIVLAVVFAFGVTLVALLMIALLPGAMLAETQITALVEKWKKRREGTGQAAD